MIEEFTLSVTAAGGAGVASGSSTSDYGSSAGWGTNGLLVAVYIPSGAPTTTDWVFSDAVAGITLFTLTNFNTAGWYSPLIPGVTIAAGVVISGAGVLIPLCNPITLAIAQSNNGTHVVRFRIQRTQ